MGFTAGVIFQFLRLPPGGMPPHPGPPQMSQFTPLPPPGYLPLAPPVPHAPFHPAPPTVAAPGIEATARPPPQESSCQWIDSSPSDAPEASRKGQLQPQQQGMPRTRAAPWTNKPPRQDGQGPTRWNTWIPLETTRKRQKSGELQWDDPVLLHKDAEKRPPAE